MRSLQHLIIKGGNIRYALAGICLMLCLAACESAPVQEMSDARQAIAVAREAGAATLAARELSEAENHLARAEHELEKRAYSRARFDAQAAKNSALQALSVAERASNKPRD